MRPLIDRVRRLLTVLSLCLVTGPALAAVNGLWSSTAGDYLLVLQDSASGTTFTVQVPASLTDVQVWMGSGSPSAISLQGVLEPNDHLVASITGQRMTGSITRAGQTGTLDASLALAWVANSNAGVWQKSTAANAYLVFCVLETGNGRLGLQIDVTLDAATRSYRYDIFTGAVSGNTFVGASLTGSGYTSRLEFGSGTLDGTQSTVARPVQSTRYTASQIAQIAN